MLTVSNTPKGDALDKMLKSSNIIDMIELTNTLTTGEVAIRYLEAIARAKGITQGNLSSKLGVCRQTLAKRFHDRSMDIDSYIATAEALDTDPIDVLAKAYDARQALAAKEGE